MEQATHDRLRYGFAKQLVMEICLSELHKLGRQGLSEILGSFFPLIEAKKRFVDSQFRTSIKSAGITRMFKSAFKRISSRTVRGEFEKCFRDSGLWDIVPRWTGGPVWFACKLHTPRAEVYYVIRTLS